MNENVVFVDTETTGLSAERHEVWEVGVIADADEYRWMLAVDLRLADPIALDIGRFHERHPQGNRFPHGSKDAPRIEQLDDFAAWFAETTHGRHLVGAIPSFDEERLRKILLGQGVAPSWHYHIIDVEALMVGWLYATRAARLESIARSQTTYPPPEVPTLPWKSEDLSRALGVNPDEFEKHTALGDARWAKAIYEKVMGR